MVAKNVIVKVFTFIIYNTVTHVVVHVNIVVTINYGINKEQIMEIGTLPILYLDTVVVFTIHSYTNIYQILLIKQASNLIFIIYKTNRVTIEMNPKFSSLITSKTFFNFFENNIAINTNKTHLNK